MNFLGHVRDLPPHVGNCVDIAESIQVSRIGAGNISLVGLGQKLGYLQGKEKGKLESYWNEKSRSKEDRRIAEEEEKNCTYLSWQDQRGQSKYCCFQAPCNN